MIELFAAILGVLLPVWLYYHLYNNRLPSRFDGKYYVDVQPPKDSYGYVHRNDIVRTDEREGVAGNNNFELVVTDYLPSDGSRLRFIWRFAKIFRNNPDPQNYVKITISEGNRSISVIKGHIPLSTKRGDSLPELAGRGVGFISPTDISVEAGGFYIARDARVNSTPGPNSVAVSYRSAQPRAGEPLFNIRFTGADGYHHAVGNSPSASCYTALESDHLRTTPLEPEPTPEPEQPTMWEHLLGAE